MTCCWISEVPSKIVWFNPACSVSDAPVPLSRWFVLALDRAVSDRAGLCRFFLGIEKGIGQIFLDFGGS